MTFFPRFFHFFLCLFITFDPQHHVNGGNVSNSPPSSITPCPPAYIITLSVRVTYVILILFASLSSLPPGLVLRDPQSVLRSWSCYSAQCFVYILLLLGVNLGGGGQQFVPADHSLTQVHLVQPHVGLADQSLLHKLAPV